MKTAFISHSDCLKHLTPPYHPESSQRLQTILNRLNNSEFSELLRVKAPMGKIKDIMRVHPERYIKKIGDLKPNHDIISVDADTYLSSGSYTASLRSVGAVIKAVDLVMGSKAKNAFCATRPPGHHAEKEKAMGFCLFGSVAIGAKYALEVYNLNRIAIVDFDVHHGNGTQNLLWDEPRILFFSSHQYPLFPGSGASAEIGLHNNIINLPISPNTDGSHYIKMLRQKIIPKLFDYRPQLLILSAGFDAHTQDPLSNLNWETKDYATITNLLVKVAAKTCNNRVVSFLEGGYNLTALGDSVEAHVRVLMEA